MDLRDKQAAKKHKRERVSTFWAFLLSFLFTVLAFIAVWTGAIEQTTIFFLFLLLLALVQALVQLFYFMHLKDKGHRFPVLFIFSSSFVALVVIYGITEWIWW